MNIPDDYYAATRTKPPHPLLVRFASMNPNVRSALDLGCGSGVGARFMIDLGWHVTAVDVDDRAIAETKIIAPSATIVQAAFIDFEFPEIDAVVAGFSLFFLSASEFESVWPRLVASIRPGGWFVGQFLGPNDEWRDVRLTHTIEAVNALFDGFEIMYCEEAERQGETAMGTPKYWHVFHVIAQKVS